MSEPVESAGVELPRELRGGRWAGEPSAAARAVHRALLAGVLAAGAAPDDAALAEAAGIDRAALHAALRELDAADWIGLDDDGRLVAAYPFAPGPTGISVAIDGARRAVMCAVDALGVAPMLGVPLRVDASCPHCGATIAVEVALGGVTASEPAGAVVIRRRSDGAAHRNRCAATRFACSATHARAWIAAHGTPDDEPQPLAASFAEGRALFAAGSMAD